MCKTEGRDWQWEKLDLALVGRTLLSKALIKLSADEWGCTPSLVVVWPEATQPWGLESLCQGGPSSAPVPGEPLLTHASTGGPPTQAGSLGSVSCGVSAPLLWVLVCAKFCLCPSGPESLFLSVLWKPNQVFWALKAIPWGVPVPLLDPQAESLMWVSEPSQ